MLHCWLLSGSVLLAQAPGAPQCEEHWVPGVFSSAGWAGPHRCLAEFAANGQSHLYMGRDINPWLLRWDGFEFQPMPLQTNGRVLALLPAEVNGTPVLYAGGDFTAAPCCATMSHVGRWNGTTWSPLGPGLNGNVHALALFNDGTGETLYAGGEFFQNQFQGIHYVAKWTGITWVPLSTGVPVFNDLNGAVHAMCSFDDGNGAALYVGGEFTTASGVTVNRIAKWDGATWSSLGSGMSGAVRALAVHDDGTGAALYAGGAFTTAGGSSVNYVARWNGVAWSDVGNGMNDSVHALHSHMQGEQQILHAGGVFTEAGGAPAMRTAAWNGTQWIAPQPGMSDGSGRIDIVSTFGEYKGELFAAGNFALDVPGASPSQDVVRWNNPGWAVLGQGLSYEVFDFVEFESFDDSPALYAAGGFTFAGGQRIRAIAKWDGSSWTQVGDITGGDCNVLRVFDLGDGPTLYASGSGLTDQGRILKFVNGDWTDLGFGIEDVYAMEVFDSGSGPELYVGGNFSTAGGVPANRIAKWSRGAWSPVGAGFNTPVGALQVYDDGGGAKLFAGGSFTSAGGIPANYIASWDGTKWEAVGGGLSGPGGVSALEVFDDGSGTALYAGGRFTSAGGQPANRIARWNGSSWSALGSGADDSVLTIYGADDGPDATLYIGGSFLNVDGVPASRIARWDSRGWQSLGAGTTLPVRALQVHDDGSGLALFAGGQFQAAGGVESLYIAKWSLCPSLNPADITGDGTVNVADLLAVISAWGPCSGCAADIAPAGGDGLVNVADLLMVISNWG